MKNINDLTGTSQIIACSLLSFAETLCRPVKITKLSIKFNSEVHGIACLSDRVFVVSRNDEIDVYQKTAIAFQQMTGIQVTNLTKLSDIAACKRNECLYLADGRIYGIWRVSNPLAENASVEKFVPVRKPQGMSVSPGGHVVVVTEAPYTLLIYNSSGRCVQMISLQSLNIEDPCKAVLVNGNYFIIASGLTTHRNHVVTKVSIDGIVEVRDITLLNWPTKHV